MWWEKNDSYSSAFKIYSALLCNLRVDTGYTLPCKQVLTAANTCKVHTILKVFQNSVVKTVLS